MMNLKAFGQHVVSLDAQIDLISPDQHFFFQNQIFTLKGKSTQIHHFQLFSKNIVISSFRKSTKMKE